MNSDWLCVVQSGERETREHNYERERDWERCGDVQLMNKQPALTAIDGDVSC